MTDSDNLLRDAEAEKAVLGSVMVRPELYPAIAETITPGDFHSPTHETVWRAIGDQLAAGAPVDPVSLANALGERPNSERALYLSRLYGEALPGSAEYHADIVRQKARLRGAAETATRVRQALDNPSTTAEQLAELLRGGLEDLNARAAPGWEDPVAIPSHRLPPFPTSLLGESLAAWVRAQSASLNVAEDLVAFSALAAISTAVGGRRRVRVKDGWSDENVCLYLLGLAGSSARKTPALDAASAALRRRAAEIREERRPQVEENEQLIRIAESEREAAERAAANGKGSKDEARAVLEELRELRDKPGLPTVLVSDVTLEALGKLMGENGGRMALLESEAGFFKACAGLYGNGRADITLPLKAYSGTGHDIQRVSRGATWIPNTSLTLALIIQPGVVEHLEKDNPEFKSSGFLNRFLYALPAPMPPGTFDTPAVPAAVSVDYDRRIEALMGSVWTAENITTMQLTAGARKVFADFYNDTEARKADGGDLDDLAEWAGKLCGQVIRLAACLALYDNHAASEITEEVMHRALSLAPYLVAHARAAFALMSRDGDAGRKLTRDILERLGALADKDGTVTERKVRESFKGRRASATGNVDSQAIQEALSELESLGWVAKIPQPPRKPGQRGARPSPRYDLHPWILKPPTERTAPPQTDSRYSSEPTERAPEPFSGITGIGFEGGGPSGGTPTADPPTPPQAPATPNGDRCSRPPIRTKPATSTSTPAATARPDGVGPVSPSSHGTTTGVRSSPATASSSVPTAGPTTAASWKPTPR